jgi:PAS domain S-box-containing protein
MEKEIDPGKSVNQSDESSALRAENAKLKASDVHLRQIISSLRRVEELFKVITETGRDIIFAADKSGTITYASPSVERSLGYKPEDLIGRRVFDYIVTSELPRAMHDFNQAILAKEGEAFSHAFTMSHKDGSERFLEGVGMNMADNAVISAFVMNMQDVTAQRKPGESTRTYRQSPESSAGYQVNDMNTSNVRRLTEPADSRSMEQILRQSEDKYQSLLNNAGDAILTADEKGNLLEANRKAEELFGYTIEEIVGSHISRIHPPEEWDKIWNVFQGLASNGRQTITATFILTKDGRKIPVDITGTAIEFKGHIIIQGIFRDATGVRMKESALLAARDKMEQHTDERTSELEKANKDLEEANIALRVLLNRQTEDNKKLEERLQVNIEELVVPYLEKLKQAGLNGKYHDYLTLLEANLNDIVSPFIQNISAVYRNLTPTEIRVAEMIKQGRASKDIAEVLNASVGTINTHRNNIRKKLNLRKQNKNLRSYLLTLG